MFSELRAYLPVTVPQGKGFAMGMIDYGQEHHLIWIVIMDRTGEIWCVPNPDVRVRPNVSMGAVRA